VHQSRWNSPRVDQLTILRFRTLIERQEVSVEANVQNRKMSVGHI
jgi:hypothetical protein